LLLLVGAVTVGLFLFATPAEAHGVHSTPIEAVDVETDHAAHGHLGHCHGGSFCPGAAVFSLAPLVPEPMLRGARFARPEPATADTAPTAFDPPPPRFLI